MMIGNIRRQGKGICNIVSNPNIRYLIVFGPESPGHLLGDAILALAENGVTERKCKQYSTAFLKVMKKYLSANSIKTDAGK